MKKKKEKQVSEQTLKGRRALKVFAILIVNFLLLFGLYRIVLQLGENYRNPVIYYVLSMVYVSAACGLFLAYYILNGWTMKKEIPEWDDLPARWTDEKKAEYLRKLPERRKSAKQLIYIFLPLLLVLFISYVEIYLLA